MDRWVALSRPQTVRRGACRYFFRPPARGRTGAGSPYRLRDLWQTIPDDHGGFRGGQIFVGARGTYSTPAPNRWPQHTCVSDTLDHHHPRSDCGRLGCGPCESAVRTDRTRRRIAARRFSYRRQSQGSACARRRFQLAPRTRGAGPHRHHDRTHRATSGKPESSTSNLARSIRRAFRVAKNQCREFPQTAETVQRVTRIAKSC